jgi:hypothetical protein
MDCCVKKLLRYGASTWRKGGKRGSEGKIAGKILVELPQCQRKSDGVYKPPLFVGLSTTRQKRKEQVSAVRNRGRLWLQEIVTFRSGSSTRTLTQG